MCEEEAKERRKMPSVDFRQSSSTTIEVERTTQPSMKGNTQAPLTLPFLSGLQIHSFPSNIHSVGDSSTRL